ncbi:MAG TPA: RIP metalloprotease RseP [Mariprofundaceae bacterium]|nr:RIP metalloprotease RseP [Mariprofundaceae bacterium]
MIELLHTTLSFVVAIALLIAVHEFGHFIVARKLGIKVEKFSIGFGPALVSWRSRDREVLYVIAAIPLGGYVKMLGENPDEQGDEAKVELSEADKKRAFDVQPVWKRAAVSVAGPGFNFLFAIVAYMMIGWLGQTVLPPVVGHIAPASIAEQAGILVGDRVQAVDGKDVHSWQQMEEFLKSEVGEDVSLSILRDSESMDLRLHVPVPDKDPLLLNVADELLGFDPGLSLIIDHVVAGSPAERAGLKDGDIVEQVNGQQVSDIQQFISQIKSHAGSPMDVAVTRDNILFQLQIVPEKDEQQQGKIGVRLTSRSVNGTETYRMNALQGLQYGFVRTWEMSALTLQVFGKMLTAAISPDNLGGPIAIAQLAGKTAELGLVSFLTFLALISVNLGVLNLLPIPILDGGHLVYLGLEKLRGRPLAPKVMEKTQMIGLLLIIALMVFAFYNDISRLFRG